MPGVEMLRMTSSGTEAAMSAIRLARAATGREQILKFAGAYHGHVDGLLAQAGSGLATQALPVEPRRHRRARRRTRSCAVERPEALRAAIAPSTSSRRSSPSRCPPTWASSRPARASSSCCASRPTASGALLVFDEVISGFRVARGGAQELTGVRADLTVMGKIIGGGLPAAAATAAARELMELIAPAGDVYQAGTLSGNPLAVAAGLATLALLDEPAYLRLAATTAALADGLREPPRPGTRSQVASAPGLLTVFFSDRAGRELRRRASLRPRALRARGAASCSPAASTRRRRSSRPGSPRSPTTASRSSARSRRRPPPSRRCPSPRARA